MQSVPRVSQRMFPVIGQHWGNDYAAKTKGIELDRDFRKWLLQYKQDRNVNEAPLSWEVARVTLHHSWPPRSDGAVSRWRQQRPVDLILVSSDKLAIR
jgi:hypothetical protein